MKILFEVSILIIVTNTAISQTFSYFPLSPGNKWFFKESNEYIYTILIAAEDTILNDGNQYIRIDKYDRGGNIVHPDTFRLTQKGYSYLRQEDSLIIEYPDILIFNFNMDIADSVMSFYGYPYPAVLDTIFLENVFGRILSTYLFFFTQYDHYSFTDSIGFNILWATTWHNWIPRYLAGCIIDGIEYGNTITSIKEKQNYKINEYKLNQNFPNPFNSSTTITFSIPERELVTITLHDMVGRKTKTILNEIINSGKHSLRLEMKSFASGIYYYRMKAGKYSEYRLLLLIK